MKETQRPTLRKAIQQMNTYKDTFDLQENFWMDSMSLFRKLLKKDMLNGRCVYTMYAACVYLLLKKQNSTITPSSLSKSCEKEITSEKVLRASRWIQQETDIKIQPVTVEELLEKYSSKLNFTDETEEYCFSLLERCKNKNIVSGKSPRAVASGILYLGAVLKDEDVSQLEVSRVTDLSDVTVRNRYQEQAEELGLLLDVKEAKER